MDYLKKNVTLIIGNSSKVQYAPSVTVTPARPGMIQEGDKVISKDGFEARVDTVECIIFIFGSKFHKDSVLLQ